MWQCPVTLQTTSGRRAKFFFGRACGCVFSERAVSQVGQGGSICPVADCARPATRDWDDAACANLLIPLCPAELGILKGY